MLGGHLDSWTSATGATDNAIGCAIMMEAARILEATGAKPRRTIRVALWSGEEEGLLGSFAYVKEHFGSAESPTKDFNKLDAYWNIDDGTGRVRGASVFGPPEAAAIVAQYFKPFEEWGIYGAARVDGTRRRRQRQRRVRGGRDCRASARSRTRSNTTARRWHTNLDTYERIVPEDVMNNAVDHGVGDDRHLANRDQMLPRFAPDQMPAIPAGRRGN